MVVVRIQWRSVMILLAICGLGMVFLNLEDIVRRPESSVVITHGSAIDLPGYTGWARPVSTLAGQFRILDVPKNPRIHQNYTVSLVCDSCDGHLPWFYVRAYGLASILTGAVETVGKNRFEATIYPTLPGTYKLELVVTYSYPVDPEWFPVKNLPPPFFEGYLVNGFPLIVTIAGSKRSPVKTYCKIPDLVLGDRSFYNETIWKNANWRILDTNVGVNDQSVQSRKNVTLRGYQDARNSIGFHATYEYNHCKLRKAMHLCDKTLHIIMIGDSVFRLQRDHLQLLFPDLKITFMELFGGMLRCSRLPAGPNVTDFLISAMSQTAVVIFNSGMHDIHRLCGHEFADERPMYLTSTELALPCTDVYRSAIRSLAKIVQAIPAELRIFQTTTAAWPKYGNYGVSWDPRYPQELPLDSKFAEIFNDIAVQEIQKLSTAPRIEITDTYWMTLARPDNRETNKNADIGKKLSHPGQEVITHMVRLWWHIVTEHICPK